MIKTVRWLPPGITYNPAFLLVIISNLVTLSKKVELIKLAEKSGKIQRKLAEDFAIGRSQVFNILKRKREFIDAFEQNAPDTKRKLTLVHWHHLHVKLSSRPSRTTSRMTFQYILMIMTF